MSDFEILKLIYAWSHTIADGKKLKMLMNIKFITSHNAFSVIVVESAVKFGQEV